MTNPFQTAWRRACPTKCFGRGSTPHGQGRQNSTGIARINGKGTEQHRRRIFDSRVNYNEISQQVVRNKIAVVLLLLLMMMMMIVMVVMVVFVDGDDGGDGGFF